MMKCTNLLCGWYENAESAPFASLSNYSYNYCFACSQTVSMYLNETINKHTPFFVVEYFRNGSISFDLAFDAVISHFPQWLYSRFSVVFFFCLVDLNMGRFSQTKKNNFCLTKFKSAFMECWNWNRTIDYNGPLDVGGVQCSG